MDSILFWNPFLYSGSRVCYTVLVRQKPHQRKEVKNYDTYSERYHSDCSDHNRLRHDPVEQRLLLQLRRC